MRSSTFNQDKIEKLQRYAKSKELRYQQIPGLDQSNASDRSYLNKFIFDTRSEGRTLLDVGSNLGYFCIEASRRGYARATGIETDSDTVHKAREIAAILDAKADYIHAEFEVHDFASQQFDDVICLNVLHHLFDPVHAIHKMIALARSRVIIEFAVPTIQDLLRARIAPLAYLAKFAPTISLGESKGYSDGSRTFLFSPKALKMIFEKHFAVFDEVKTISTPHKGRLILVATKKRIRDLVLVAGFNSAGKSTLVEKLKSDRELRQQVGMSDGEWHFTNASPKRLPSGDLDQVIFHYDLLHSFGRSSRTLKRDIALGLLGTADRVIVLTLATPVHTLIERLQNKILKGKKNKRRDERILEAYKDKDFLALWQRDWDEFLSERLPKSIKFVVQSRGDGYIFTRVDAPPLREG